ncbi:hypothetical protein VW35_12795 [Devosia soli]|uniref:Uncharacterized protein n=1 Tax=Devosia soli TaxID=361041 RepID=A0A0F5L8M6_9HYPH|nr:hypothetical protein VW35_12795 [Devosia soli]
MTRKSRADKAKHQVFRPFHRHSASLSAAFVPVFLPGMMDGAKTRISICDGQINSAIHYALIK